MTPFLSFYTPTYRRPQGLERCLASVGAQTLAAEIEQIVIPDHVGLGIGGMYARVPQYVEAVHGRYVHFLADDDVLTSPVVVQQVKDFAEVEGFPPLILVQAEKDGARWPVGQVWPPVCGQIDLGCGIVRADIWKAHAHCYGHRYEGDYDFLSALAASGVEAKYLPLLFSRGAVSRGEAEAA